MSKKTTWSRKFAPINELFFYTVLLKTKIPHKIQHQLGVRLLSRGTKSIPILVTEIKTLYSAFMELIEFLFFHINGGH